MGAGNAGQLARHLLLPPHCLVRCGIVPITLTVDGGFALPVVGCLVSQALNKINPLRCATNKVNTTTGSFHMSAAELQAQAVGCLV
jgi:hypothetical protein